MDSTASTLDIDDSCLLPSISTKQNNLPKVIYLAVCFTVLSTAYIASFNFIAQLYTQLGYNDLGQTCVFTAYLTFGIASMLAPHINRKIAHKTSFMIGAAGYIVFVSIGTLTSYCGDDDGTHGLCNRDFLYFINIGVSVMNGITDATFWLAQSDYINQCADKQTTGLYNGTFWSIMQISQITSSVIATVILSRFDQYMFYLILLGCVAFSLVMFSFVPPVPQSHRAMERNEIDARENLGQSLKRLGKALIKSDSRFIKFPMLLGGIIVSYYTSYMLFIVDETVPSKDANVINQKMGFVLIALAFGEISSGIIVGKLVDRFNKIKLLNLGIFIVELALVSAIMAHYSKIYAINVIGGFLWGFSETGLVTIITSIIGLYFNGALELYSIMRVLNSCGVGYGYVIGTAYGGEYIGKYLMALTAVILSIHGIFVFTSGSSQDLLIAKPNDSKTKKLVEYDTLLEEL